MIIIRGPNNQCGPPAKRPRVSSLLADRIFFIASSSTSSPSLHVVSRVRARRCIPGIRNEVLFCRERADGSDIPVCSFELLCKMVRQG